MNKNMHTPLVTVGIPTYNRPQGLERTLECITQQTYANLEIIVSDNNSTDAAVLHVLEKYSKKDARVKYYVQQKNISIVPNFQFLLDKASGEYFMWAADDDFWDDNFIEVCVKSMVENKEVVLSMPSLKIVDVNGGHEEARLNRGFMQKGLLSRCFNFVKSTEDNKYFFCGLYRSSAVKNIPFENNWGGDHMFLFEAITKGKFLYLPGQANFYYFRGGSSTNIERVRKAFNIKTKYFFYYAYIFKYAYYQFRFKHINIVKKIGLFFSNTLALIFNEDGILYWILIKKPFKKLISKIKKLFSAGTGFKPTYNQDGLTTLHNNGFMYEADFARAEKAGAATGSWANIHWRVHTILWAAFQCKDVEGDFVECGTNKGGFARAILEYLDFATINKSFYLLDTFEGLSENLLTDAEKKAGKKEHFENVYKSCYDEVKQTFASFPFVRLIKGTVPDTLSQVPSEKIAFLSVDMNSIVPEIAALDYFWNKLSAGGIIVLDDYAYVTCDLQYQAHNKWAREKGIKILSLSTGQGLIVK